ncbi:hypothetical protein Pint_26115 [Pistacia integerrima]|uniref:Uncharacterized protein n=1 Tax=Pistacia integerrima TaxID=434235 RepID=A0ACC0YCY8_9ROSI|nr:hypothetical protein Pint_26115 [Pistacia integerrima]
MLAIMESYFDPSPGQTEEPQDFEFDQSPGQVSFEERYELEEIISLEEAFSFFNVTRDGFIDPEELSRILNRLAVSSHYWFCSHKEIQCEISLCGKNYKDRNWISAFINMWQALLFSRAFPGQIFTEPNGSLPGVPSNNQNSPVTEAHNPEEISTQANTPVPNAETSSTPFSYNATSDPEDQRDPSSPPGNPEEQSHPNNSSLVKTFLTISAGAVYTLLTIRYSSNTSLSHKAKILSCFAAACNFFGFLFCLFGMLLSDPRPGGAPRARIVLGIGYIFVAYGFIAVMALQMWESDLLLWVSAVASVGLFPALIYAIFIRDESSKCAHWRCW